MTFNEEYKKYEEDYIADIVHWVFIKEKDENSEYGKIANIITNPKNIREIELAKKLIAFFNNCQQIIIRAVDGEATHIEEEVVNESTTIEEQTAKITYNVLIDKCRNNSFTILKKISVPKNGFDLEAYISIFNNLSASLLEEMKNKK